MARTITLHVDGDAISALALHHKFGAFLNMLRMIDRNVTDELEGLAVSDHSVKWVVASIQAGSPVNYTLRAEPVRDDVLPMIAEQIIASGVGGLAQVESEKPLQELPRYFTFPVMEAARDLAKTTMDGITAVSVRTEDLSVTLSRKATLNLERFLRAVFEFEGTVEGILMMVSVAGRPHFSVRDPLSNRAIRCTVPRNRLSSVLEGFDRRVVVNGMVKTNERGDVLSISMEDIEVFPFEEDLPSLRDVAGKFDITRGKSVREHLEGLWGAS